MKDTIIMMELFDFINYLLINQDRFNGNFNFLVKFKFFEESEVLLCNHMLKIKYLLGFIRLHL